MRRYLDVAARRRTSFFCDLVEGFTDYRAR